MIQRLQIEQVKVTAGVRVSSLEDGQGKAAQALLESGQGLTGATPYPKEFRASNSVVRCSQRKHEGMLQCSHTRAAPPECMQPYKDCITRMHAAIQRLHHQNACGHPRSRTTRMHAAIQRLHHQNACGHNEKTPLGCMHPYKDCTTRMHVAGRRLHAAVRQLRHQSA
eukprot:scaffold73789_cov21-Tisochrysis_lutea.AAC.2